MQVTKRDGHHELVSLVKVTSRLRRLCYGLHDVDPYTVAIQTEAILFHRIPTTAFDQHLAKICAGLPGTGYDVLAGRIIMSHIHKASSKVFSDSMTQIWYQSRLPLDDPVYTFVMANAEPLDAAIIHARDYSYPYHTVRSMERWYLLPLVDQAVERPQHMFMRHACTLHTNNLEQVIAAYHTTSKTAFRGECVAC